MMKVTRVVTCTSMLVFCLLAAAQTAPPIRAELNGLRIAVDANSGGLLELEYGDMKFLRAAPGSESLLDAAYPGYGFEPLRLGVRY